MEEITYERAEKALAFLSETDEVYAMRKANMERLKYKMKRIHSAIFLREDGTVAERTAKSDCHEDYINAQEAYFAEMEMFETVRNQRDRAELLIDLWRSTNSARTKGAQII